MRPGLRNCQAPVIPTELHTPTAPDPGITHDLAAGLRIPQPNRSIPTRTGEQISHVVKPHTQDMVGVSFERRLLPAVLSVPNGRVTSATANREQFPIRTPSQASDMCRRRHALSYQAGPGFEDFYAGTPSAGASQPDAVGGKAHLVKGATHRDPSRFLACNEIVK